MSNDVSRACVDCEDCRLIAAPHSDPVKILERLPSALWNRSRPSSGYTPALKVEDILHDDTVFGPVGADDATLQYEIARVVAGERDVFVQGLKQTRALMLGAGRITVDSHGRAVTQCPHANGPDLDVVGRQYGIGRPTGFTDACYWRLIQLIRFKAGNRRWLLREVAVLYTGERPDIVESPARVQLFWPSHAPTDDDFGHTYFSTVGAPPSTADGYFNDQSFLIGDAGDDPTDIDGFWASAADPATEADTFWHSGSITPTGLQLIQALKMVTAAGVAVELNNQPRPGFSGCYGATLRGGPGSADRGFFSSAT